MEDKLGDSVKVLLEVIFYEWPEYEDDNDYEKDIDND